jgi:hypothetical protein
LNTAFVTIVEIQGLTAGGIERSVSRGKRLLLQLDQQVRDGLAGGQCNVDRGSAVVDRVDDGLIARNRAALILGDGVDGAIVTRGGDLHAAVDGALGLGQRALSGAEVLQRRHGGGIGIDAK